MRATKESVAIAKHISTFLSEYMPSQKTKSEYTIKSYDEALCLYIGFLETEKGVNDGNLCGNCFCAENIESWLVWLRDVRGNSPETCNTRLASLRAFIKYLGKQELKYLYLPKARPRLTAAKPLRQK